MKLRNLLNVAVLSCVFGASVEMACASTDAKEDAQFQANAFQPMFHRLNEINFNNNESEISKVDRFVQSLVLSNGFGQSTKHPKVARDTLHHTLMDGWETLSTEEQHQFFDRYLVKLRSDLIWRTGDYVLYQDPDTGRTIYRNSRDTSPANLLAVSNLRTMGKIMIPFFEGLNGSSRKPGFSFDTESWNQQGHGKEHFGEFVRSYERYKKDSIIPQNILTHFPNLQVLDISNNGLTSENVVPLMEVLKTNLTLKHFDLSNNPIGKAGQSIGEMLQQNTALEEVNLDGCELQWKYPEEIIKALESNRTLRILSLGEGVLMGTMNSLDNIRMDLLRNALKINTTLETLTFSGWGHDIEEYPEDSDDFIDNGFDDDGSMNFDWLEVNTSLTSLSFEDSFINELRSLMFSEALKKNTTLKHLAFNGTHLDTESLMGAYTSNPNLESLAIYVGLDHYEMNFRPVIDFLEHSNTLKKLAIMPRSTEYPEFYEDLARHLKANTGLEKLLLDLSFDHDDKIQMILSAVSQNNSLRKLTIEKIGIDENIVRLVQECLTVNQGIQKIVFSDVKASAQVRELIRNVADKRFSLEN